MKKLPFLLLLGCVLLISLWGCSRKENKAVQAPETEVVHPAVESPKPVVQALPAKTVEDSGELPSKEYVRLAWEASSKNDVERIQQLVEEATKIYGPEALLQQSDLSALPTKSQEDQYRVLNDVGTLQFILAEGLMNAGRKEEAIAKFQDTIQTYPFAQSFDPSRGAFWSIAQKSQASIDVLTGKMQEYLDHQQPADVLRTKPMLHMPGTERLINYSAYGEFKNIGTAQYEYVIKDMASLRAAAGEGIYPNERDVYKNPRLEIVRSEGRLKHKHWDYALSQDFEAAYFKWVSAPEAPGVKLFYIANIFEKSGMWEEAIKAYYAIVVHFPKTVAWTYWNTPWYPSQAAISKIKYLIQLHPELNLDYFPMSIHIQNSYDNTADNDVFIVNPGRLVDLTKISDEERRQLAAQRESLPLKNIKQKVGSGKVRLVQYDNGHWQMLVNDKPFVLKAVTYVSTKVGQTPDKGTLTNWQFDDFNANGVIDGPFEAWVDKNWNNTRDTDEPIVGDFQLMKEMGVNAIRFYHIPTTPNKELLREMYSKYGIGVVMGDFMGKYAISSGASWSEGTDYENPEHRKHMFEAVKKMVLEHKDEPYVLIWLLGNENNYGVASNADKKPEAFFKFVNEVAQWIKSVDPNHPVAVNNGDTLFLDVFAKHAPDVDIFTANVYRGDYGFGSFWEQVADVSGKPAFITEYGAPAYAPHLTLEEGEEAQAHYHQGNWMDIENNTAGNPRGVGNALGGVMFQWMDEWWKNYEPFLHDRHSETIGPFPGGYYFEEWFGIIGQGNGSQSPYLRHLRKAYFMYKDFWNR